MEGTFLHPHTQEMNRKRGDFQGLVTGKDKEKTMIVNDMPNLEEIQRFSNPISNQPIPLSSIYFTLQNY